MVLNVAAVLPTAAGFLTVFPCGQPRPNASNLNYVIGDQIANSVLARVGTGGNVCIYSSAETDVLVDVSGYFTDFVSLVQLALPSRMLDTRTPTGQTVDGLHQAVGRVAVRSRAVDLDPADTPCPDVNDCTSAERASRRRGISGSTNDVDHPSIECEPEIPPATSE